MIWVRHWACIGEKYTGIVQRPERKRSLARVGHTRKDNIKMEHKEIKHVVMNEICFKITISNNKFMNTLSLQIQ
jgi:hypothetical protein